MAESALVGVLRVLLTANTAEYTTGLKSAEKSTKDFEKAVEDAKDKAHSFSLSARGVSEQFNRISKAFDGSKIIRDANVTAAAIEKLGGAGRLTAAEQRKVNATVVEAIEKYKALGQTAPAHLHKLADATKQAATHVGGLSGVLQTAIGTFAGFISAQAVISGVATAFKTVVGGAITMNASLEKTTLQFATLMGDADKAKAHVKDLFEFAKKTPFETEPIIAASKAMRAAGGDALDTKENLTLLGDAAAATGAPIDELGRWVGRLYANLQAGKPFGDAAQRLGELNVLAPQARVQLERMKEAGATAQQVFVAFQKELGRFSGAMKLQAGTWEGVISTLSDTINLTLADAFRDVFEVARDSMGKIADLLSSEELSTALGRVGKALSEAMTGAVGDDRAAQVKGMTGLIVGLGRAMVVVAELTIRAAGAIGMLIEGARSLGAAVVLPLLTLMTKASEMEARMSRNPALQRQAAIDRAALDEARRYQAQLHANADAAMSAARGHGPLIESLRDLRGALDAAEKGLTFTTAALEGTGGGGGGGGGTGGFTGGVEKATKKTKEFLGVVQQLPGALSFGAAAFGAVGDFIGGVFSPAGGFGRAGNRQNPFGGVFGTGLIGAFGIPVGVTSGLQPWMMGDIVDQNPNLSAQLAAVGLGLGQQGAGKAGFFGQFGNLLQQNLSGLITSVFAGGGNLGKSLGSFAGGSVGSIFGGSMQSAMRGLGGMAPKFLSFLGGALGPLGSALGGLIAPLLGKLFGPSEGRLASQARGQWIAGMGGGEAFNQRFRDAQVSPEEARRLTMTLMSATSRKEVEQAQAAIEAALARNNALLQQQEQIESQIADVESERQRIIDSLKVGYADVLSIAQKYNLSVEGLGTAINQAGTTANFTQIVNDLEALNRAAQQAGGELDWGGALSGMKEEINALILDAQRMGTAIPENMRPFIEELIRSGQLLDENGEKMTDLGDLNWGPAVETDAQKANTALEKIDKTLSDLNDTLKDIAAALRGDLPSAAQAGATGIENAINGIDPNPITVRVNYDDPGYEPREGGAQTYGARGGLVTAAGIQYRQLGGQIVELANRWRPRGTDTVPAMLTPGELVLTLEQQRGLASVLGASGITPDIQGRAGMAGVTEQTVVVVQGGGSKEDLLERIMAALPRKTRTNDRGFRTLMRDALGVA